MSDADDKKAAEEAKAEADAKAKADEAAVEAKAKADAEAAAKAKEDEGKTVPLSALHEEREKRKTAQKELESAQKKIKESEKSEADRKTKLAEKKGEHKKLYDKAKEENTSLTEKITGLETKVKGLEEASTKRIDDSIDLLKKKEDKETVKDLLKGKSLADQERLLPKILKGFSLPSSVNKGVDGEGGNQKEDTEANREKAKEANNSLLAIKNAKEVEE